MRKLGGIATLVWAGLLVACADLVPMQAGVCGNGVVEPAHGEDCDLFPQGQCVAPEGKNPCRLMCSGTLACPAGYGCGGDGLCRKPSGELDYANAFPLSQAFALEAADFDGDGTTDLLASGIETTLLLYSDGTGTGAEPHPMPASPAAMAVGDLTGDGLPDVGSIYREAMLMIARSRQDRTVQPAVSSPFLLGNANTARPLIMDAMPARFEPPMGMQYVGDEILMFANNALVSEDNGQVGLSLLPADTGDIVSLSIAQLAEDPVTSPCEEIVVAFKDRGAIWVYSPCAYDNAAHRLVWNEWNNAKPIAKATLVQLPQGVKPLGVILADFNADGHQDMLVTSDAGGVVGNGGMEFSNSMIAYGNGTGTFHSDRLTIPTAPLPGDGQTGEPRMQAWGRQLAAGDLNGDNCPDVVTSSGVFLAVSDCKTVPVEQMAYTPVAYTPQGAWEFGEIRDLNANGIPDVLVGSSQSMRATFFNGVGDGMLNEYTVPLNGLPGQPVFGDFDGDLILDVAFPEKGRHGTVPAGVETGDSISISFGNPFGAPSAPINMGRLNYIQSMAAGNLSSFYPDGIHDLMVVSKPEEGTTLTAAVLAGSSDRQLFAPFYFTAEQGGFNCRAFTILTGNFDGDAQNHRDLATFTTTDAVYDNSGVEVSAAAVKLWLMPVTGEASINAAAVTLSDAVPVIAAERNSPLVAAVDLNDDGTDEIVALSWTRDPVSWARSGTLQIAHVETSDQNQKQFVFDPTQSLPEMYEWTNMGASAGGDGPVPLSGSLSTVLSDTVMTYWGQIKAEDIDGDGARDIIALGANVDPATQLMTTQLSVFLNTRDGKLHAENRIALTMPDDLNPQAFTLLNADDDPALELFVVFNGEAMLGDIDLQTGVVTELREYPSMGKGHGAVTGDFNSDGVDDVAVLFDDTVRTYLGKPVVR